MSRIFIPILHCGEYPVSSAWTHPPKQFHRRTVSVPVGWWFHISHLRQAAQRTSAWSVRTETAKYGNGSVDRGYIGHKSAKMMKRAKTIEARQKQAIEEKSGLLKNTEYTENLKLFPQKYHTDTLASFSHICICYDRKPVCGPLSFSVQQAPKYGDPV